MQFVVFMDLLGVVFCVLWHHCTHIPPPCQCGLITAKNIPRGSQVATTSSRPCSNNEDDGNMAATVTTADNDVTTAG
jgi:hypothetical protein